VSLDGVEVPKQFAYSSGARPHELCLLAAKELQSHLILNR